MTIVDRQTLVSLALKAGMTGPAAQEHADAVLAEARIGALAEITALREALRTVLQDAHKAWDSGRDSRVGKLLFASLGRVPGYREDTDLIADFLRGDAIGKAAAAEEARP